MMKALAALIILSLAAAPAAAATPCLTPNEVRAFAALLTGPLFTATAERCRVFPGSTPLLTAAAPTLKQRFAAERAAAVPIVGPKLMAMFQIKNASSDQIIEVMGPAVMLGLQSELGALDAASCRSTDIIAGPLLNLSDSQLTAILGEILFLAMRKTKDDSFKLCPA